MSEQLPPLQVRHLFKPLDDKLMELLYSLTQEEWHAPTIAKQWNVKDIAAHLLDGNTRALSQQREKYFGEAAPRIHSYSDLVTFINQQNADWVKAAKRISPNVLILLHEATGKLTSEYFSSVNLFDKAIFSVAWAGEEQSLNWMHIAREYTEKWLHQQQIRDAVNRPGIMTKEFFYPFIDTFMYALPHTYREIDAEENTAVQINISSGIGGCWYLTRTRGRWILDKACTNIPATVIDIDPDTAWKLFSKGMKKEQAKDLVYVKGDELLGNVILNMVSVIA